MGRDCPSVPAAWHALSGRRRRSSGHSLAGSGSHPGHRHGGRLPGHRSRRLRRGRAPQGGTGSGSRRPHRPLPARHARCRWIRHLGCGQLLLAACLCRSGGPLPAHAGDHDSGARAEEPAARPEDAPGRRLAALPGLPLPPPSGRDSRLRHPVQVRRQPGPGPATTLPGRYGLHRVPPRFRPGHRRHDGDDRRLHRRWSGDQRDRPRQGAVGSSESSRSSRTSGTSCSPTCRCSRAFSTARWGSSPYVRGLAPEPFPCSSCA